MGLSMLLYIRECVLLVIATFVVITIEGCGSSCPAELSTLTALRTQCKKHEQFSTNATLVAENTKVGSCADFKAYTQCVKDKECCDIEATEGNCMAAVIEDGVTSEFVKDGCPGTECVSRQSQSQLRDVAYLLHGGGKDQSSMEPLVQAMLKHVQEAALNDPNGWTESSGARKK